MKDFETGLEPMEEKIDTAAEVKARYCSTDNPQTNKNFSHQLLKDLKDFDMVFIMCMDFLASDKLY